MIFFVCLKGKYDFSFFNFTNNYSTIIFIDFSFRKKSQSIISARCPQQDNGYDCGVFTVLYAELIGSMIDDILNSSCPQLLIEEALATSITKEKVLEFRSKILDEINDLIIK